MAFTLDNVVPWGRSFDEYVAMFALSRENLRGRILGCADGPSSFNAELTRQDGRVVSVDPLYAFSTAAIRARIEQTHEQVLEQTRRNRHEFVWRHIQAVEELGRLRMAAMEAFLDDYSTGASEGRYMLGELPELPLPDKAFDLALCSHFLFLYSDHFDAAWHVRAIREMCRVADECRVFPLLELGSRPSRHLECVPAALAEAGYRVAIRKVDYEFQKGGDEMLVISRG